MHADGRGERELYVYFRTAIIIFVCNEPVGKANPKGMAHIFTSERSPTAAGEAETQRPGGEEGIISARGIIARAGGKTH